HQVLLVAEVAVDGGRGHADRVGHRADRHLLLGGGFDQQLLGDGEDLVPGGLTRASGAHSRSRPAATNGRSRRGRSGRAGTVPSTMWGTGAIFSDGTSAMAGTSSSSTCS